jgi:hypothetical protein
VVKTQRRQIAHCFNEAKVSAHDLKHWKQYVVDREHDRSQRVSVSGVAFFS